MVARPTAAPTTSAHGMVEQLKVMLRSHASLLLWAVAENCVGKPEPTAPVRVSVVIPPVPDAEASHAEHSRYHMALLRETIEHERYAEAHARYRRDHARWMRDQQFMTSWYGRHPEVLERLWAVHGGAVDAANATYDRHRALYGAKRLGTIELHVDPASPLHRVEHNRVRIAELATPVAVDVPVNSREAAFLVPTLRDSIAVALAESAAEAETYREEQISRKAMQLFTRYATLARVSFPASILAQAELLFAPIARWLQKQWVRGAAQTDVASAYVMAVYLDTLVHAQDYGVGNAASTLSAAIQDSPLSMAGVPANKRDQYNEYLMHKDFRHENGDTRLDRMTDLSAMFVDPNGDEGRPQGIVQTSLVRMDFDLCHCCYTPIRDNVAVAVVPAQPQGRAILEQMNAYCEAKELPPAYDLDDEILPDQLIGFALCTAICDCTIDLLDPAQLYAAKADADFAIWVANGSPDTTKRTPAVAVAA